ncbi:helix-turn-helix domain-containing protein [Bacteroidales bacterium OttesenSCG-928-J19]|nr:helix-turn-helix domain-containing protein [Bacteroidales bacterium OttesenSCG-928-J19]
MEVIIVEKNAFEEIENRFESFCGKVEDLCEKADRGLKNWLDNQDVCLILNVSLRTLQFYRDSRKIAYSRVGHKIYYKQEDVEKMLQKIEGGVQ